MRPIRRLIPPPPQPATTGRRRQQANTEPIRRRSSSINRYRTNARSSSTVSAGTPHQNPNRRVQGMGILKPIHVGILKPQIQIQTHPYPVMECGFKPKNYVMKKKNFRDEIEEKRWSEGWDVLMAKGYGEKRVAWEEKRKRKRKKKMKEKR